MQLGILLSVIFGIFIVAAYSVLEKIWNYKVSIIVAGMIFVLGDLIIYEYIRNKYNLPRFSYGSYEYRRVYSIILIPIEIVSLIIAHFILTIGRYICKKRN